MTIKNSNIFLLIIFSIVVFFINYFLYFYLIPDLNLSSFSNLGFISTDSNVFHTESINFLNTNPKIINFVSLLYDKNFHIFFISFIYFLNLSPFYYTIINIILLIFTLNIAFKIIDQRINSNKKNQILISKIIFLLITIFLPSNFFFYSQIGKECFVIFSIIYIYNFIFNNKVFLKGENLLLNIFFLFISVHILFISKDYFILTFIIFCWIFYFVSLLAKKLQIDKNFFLKKILLISFLLIIVLVLKYIFTYGDTVQFINYYYNTVSTSLDYNLSFKNFTHEQKNILDLIVLPFNKIRYFLINWSLLNNANSLISIDIPINFNETVITYFKSLFYGIIYPAEYMSNNISILYKIAISENIFYLFLTSSVLITKNKNYFEILLVILIIFLSSVILYLNPNIGSFYKQKSLLFYSIAIYSIIHWIEIFHHIFNKISLSINKTKNNNDLFSISTKSFNLFLFIIIISFFTLFRDLFIINFFFDQPNLKIYLLLIIFMSIFSNSINMPLNDFFLSYYSQKKILEINFLAFIIFICFFINVITIKLVIKTSIINFIYIIILFLFFYMSILINSIINSYFIYKKKISYIYLSQSLSIVFSIFFLLIKKDDLNLINIINSLIIWILSNILFNLIFLNINFKNFIKKISFKNLSNNNLSIFLNNYFSYIFLNGGIITILLFNYTNTINDNSLIISLRIFLYLLGVLIVFFNFLFSPYLLLASKINNKSDQVPNFFEIVFIISSIVVFILLLSLEWILDITLSFSLIVDKDEIIKVSQIFILSFPIVICNYFFTKKLLFTSKFKLSNYINCISIIILTIILFIIGINNNYVVSTIYLLINIFQLLFFIYFLKNTDTFNFDIINLIPFILLVLFFFAITFNLIPNIFLFLLFPITTFFLKKRFYD